MIASFSTSIFLLRLERSRCDLRLMGIVEGCICCGRLMLCYGFYELLSCYDVRSVCLLFLSLICGLRRTFFVREMMGFLSQRSRPFWCDRRLVACIVLSWAFCCRKLEGEWPSCWLFLLLDCGTETGKDVSKLQLLLFFSRGWSATFLTGGQLRHLEFRIWTIHE